MNFLSFFFYQFTVLSSRAVDGYQLYSGGMIVDKVSTIGIEISPTPPLIFTGQKVRDLESFSISPKFEPPPFKNAARYPNSETNFLCSHDRPMFSPSLVKLSSRIPEKGWAKMPHPLKLRTKTCLIVNNSSVDYSISLTFCTEFQRMTPEVL